MKNLVYVWGAVFIVAYFFFAQEGQAVKFLNKEFVKKREHLCAKACTEDRIKCHGTPHEAGSYIWCKKVCLKETLLYPEPLKKALKKCEMLFKTEKAEG